MKPILTYYIVRIGVESRQHAGYVLDFTVL